MLRPQLSYSLVQFSPLGSATLAKLLDVPMVDGTSRRGKKGKKKRGREKRGEYDIKRRETKGQEKFPVVDDWMTNYSLLITKVEDTSPSRQ